MSRVQVVVAVVAVLGAVAVLFVFDPAASSIFPRCWFKSTTGWDCPGCGGTRAAHQLMHGDVAAAFRLNPLFVVGAPLFAVAWACDGFVFPAATAEALRRRRRRQVWLLVAIGVAFGIGRNVWPATDAHDHVSSSAAVTSR